MYRRAPTTGNHEKRNARQRWRKAEEKICPGASRHFSRFSPVTVDRRSGARTLSTVTTSSSSYFLYFLLAAAGQLLVSRSSHSDRQVCDQQLHLEEEHSIGSIVTNEYRSMPVSFFQVRESPMNDSQEMDERAGCR